MYSIKLPFLRTTEPLFRTYEHSDYRTFGLESSHRFRAIEQNVDNLGAIHVDLGSYADAMFAKKSGLDKRHTEEAALAMRDVTRGRVIIRDQGSKICDGQLICILTRLASSCIIIRTSWSTHAGGAKMGMSSA